mmetsp:Transcript_22205/g.61622  ORF Transcript_22205/g.61622 Transcript_22205/m.61622 type:complete len:213 (-) Transcript_22205:2118-2756(-)
MPQRRARQGAVDGLQALPWQVGRSRSGVEASWQPRYWRKLARGLADLIVPAAGLFHPNAATGWCSSTGVLIGGGGGVGHCLVGLLVLRNETRPLEGEVHMGFAPRRQVGVLQQELLRHRAVGLWNHHILQGKDARPLVLVAHAVCLHYLDFHDVAFANLVEHKDLAAPRGVSHLHVAGLLVLLWGNQGGSLALQLLVSIPHLEFDVHLHGGC